jgi:hypothetical protein
VQDLETLSTAKALLDLDDRELASVARLTRATLAALLKRDRRAGEVLIAIENLGETIKATGGADQLSGPVALALSKLFTAGHALVNDR